jgi:hypothetical protein
MVALRLDRRLQGRVDPSDIIQQAIRNRAGRVLHTENTKASDVMSWKLSWVDDDRIRLESSDRGTHEWKRQDDGSWLKEQLESATADRLR